MTIDLATSEHTIDLAAAKRALDEQGYVLFERLLDAPALARVRERLLEQAAAERSEGWAASYDADSQGVLNLLNKGAVFAELAECAPVVGLIEHLLGPGPLLSSLTANIVGPGTKPQMLHGDQAIMPAPWPYCAVANVAWILDDFTESNGATVVVPGSHVHGTHPDYADPPSTIPIIAPAGSVMVFDGRLWHGAGENTSNGRRHAIFAYYCKPFLRQQENMFLSLDAAVVQSASPKLKSLLGYTPYLGKVGIIPQGGARGAEPAAEDQSEHVSEAGRGEMDINGKWNMMAETQMGSQAFTLTLQSDGDAFTGSLFNDMGAQAISGTVEGDTLRWTTEMTTPVAVTLDYSATIHGDNLTGSVKAGPYGTTPLKGARA